MLKIPSLFYKNVLDDKYSAIRFNMAVALIKPYIKQTVKLLDIGCYSGDLLSALHQDISYYGIDTDEEALKIAHERGARVFKIDIENQILPFNDQEFDIVIAAEILEHLRDPEKIMLQIKKIIKREGIILISLPNECTIYHRIKVLFGQGIDGMGFAPHYHLHFPTIKQSNEFVKKHFKIIKEQYWVHLGEGKIEKILSKISYKFWISLSNLYPTLFARGVIYLCKLKNSKVTK